MFFLFAGQDYHAAGGMGDYKGAYATQEEAEAAFDGLNGGTLRSRLDWGQVVQERKGGLVVVSERGHYRGSEQVDRWEHAPT